jgi:hypothetical protein
MRYVIINKTTSKVVNVVEIVEGDGSQEIVGFVSIASDTGNIGDGWNGSKIVPQPMQPNPKLS